MQQMTTCCVAVTYVAIIQYNHTVPFSLIRSRPTGRDSINLSAKGEWAGPA